MRKENDIKLKSINKIIRIIDAKAEEQEYAKQKLGYRHDMIDIEARNAFKVGRVTTVMIKCIYGYNHFGKRDAMINKNMVDSTCPRCDIDEM